MEQLKLFTSHKPPRFATDGFMLFAFLHLSENFVTPVATFATKIFYKPYTAKIIETYCAGIRAYCSGVKTYYNQ